jgi:hypothetical protein
MRNIGVLAVTALAAALAAACDEISLGSDDPPASATAKSGSNAHWEKVCAKEYFYRLSDDRMSPENFCGRWEQRCVGADGRASEGCE